MTSRVTTLYLPQWKAGLMSIRCLYLSAANAFKVCKTCDVEENMIPLFLGADLFSKTGIRTENHPRFHAKFAKKGLATKLIFSAEFRIHGLRLASGVNSLWFYSIQGLFRVAFEMYSKEEQLLVLENFQELWRSRINDGLLNQSYNMELLLGGMQTQDVVGHYNQECLTKLRIENVSDLIEYETASETDPIVSCEVTAPLSNYTQFKVDHTYCRPEDGDAEKSSSPQHQVSRKIKTLEHLLQNPVTDMQKEKSGVVLLLLDCIDELISKVTNEEEVSDIILQILKAVYKLYQEQNPDVTSAYNSPLLHTVSSWLGQQFSSANSCISKQIEDFKVNHINRITDLPPAEELVSELFPESMRVLLMNWMGLSDDAASWKRHSEYPILLLILEFANHNLITGVAHVLYSSLICK
ncbi:uncharacterized protein si:ch211-110p13.9 [Polyodon spathula]|uniref:uncharacterized protein si:ch211-110p13.9 n=1 Tax=Polyodon spathula TaxID=7913 RepID=UPI001B7EDD97|nr:uncharacterized protein si:ch211-110p13.9 [Polyodon spathula]